MPTYISSVSPKGQVTIPAKIRERFAIQTKDTVHFEIVDEMITIVPARSKLLAGYRSIPPLDPPRSWKEIEQIAHEEHALHVASEGRETKSPDSD